MIPEWLPELVLLSSVGGRWDKYMERLYDFFRTDFLLAPPDYKGLRVGVKRNPLTSGREASFWHLISEGPVEEDRLPNLRRCERIRWPKRIIDHANEDTVLCWENTRRGETRALLWVPDAEFLVVLARRSGYYLMWTAYPVTRAHRKRKLQKEHDAYWRKKG